MAHDDATDTAVDTVAASLRRKVAQAVGHPLPSSSASSAAARAAPYPAPQAVLQSQRQSFDRSLPSESVDPPPGFVPKEHRYDPETGRTLTYTELCEVYAGRYSRDETRTYWEMTMTVKDDPFGVLLWRLDWLLNRISPPGRSVDHAELNGAVPANAANLSQSLSVPSSGPVVSSGSAVASQQSVAEQWTRVPSNSNPGKFYFFNKKTGETLWVQPPNAVIV